jgi:hypothetical protein
MSFSWSFPSRGAVGVVDELMSRHPEFHAGRGILLADKQVWTFPAPVGEWSFSVAAAGDEYLDLIRAILEAEDTSDQRLAELALAIFLLGQNYQLTSLDYQRLFTFQPNSTELADSQSAFHDLARDHIEYVVATGVMPMSTCPSGRWAGGLTRLLTRLRTYWPIRRLSLALRKRGCTLSRDRRSFTDLESKHHPACSH